MSKQRSKEEIMDEIYQLQNTKRLPGAVKTEGIKK